MPNRSLIAVAGASGFLGGHVVRALGDAGHEVVQVSRRTLTEDSVPAPWEEVGNRGVRMVINCAGAVRGTRRELERANVDVVASLIRRLSGRGIGLVQLGSAAEYGPGEPGRPVSEDREPYPTSAYGLTKLAATRLVLDAAGAGSVPGSLLRVFNPVGAGISDELLPGRAVKLIRRALQSGGPVHLRPLGATRDFIDARDVADAVVAAVSATDISGQVINIGTGTGTTARALVELLADVAGYAGPILESAADPPRSDEIDWEVADIARARSLLDWAPRRSLREAVAQLWGAARSPTT